MCLNRKDVLNNQGLKENEHGPWLRVSSLKTSSGKGYSGRSEKKNKGIDMRVIERSGEREKGGGSHGREEGVVSVGKGEDSRSQMEEKQERGRLARAASKAFERGIVLHQAVRESDDMRQLPRLSQAEDTVRQELKMSLTTDDMMVLDIENWEKQEGKLNIVIRDQENGKA